MTTLWAVDLVCSDPACAAEREAVVADLEELDRLACECGCCLVTLSVALFEPLPLALSR
jgi:hypothetical protein